jgi:hypothetical protein
MHELRTFHFLFFSFFLSPERHAVMRGKGLHGIEGMKELPAVVSRHGFKIEDLSSCRWKHEQIRRTSSKKTAVPAKESFAASHLEREGAQEICETRQRNLNQSQICKA